MEKTVNYIFALMILFASSVSLVFCPKGLININSSQTSVIKMPKKNIKKLNPVILSNTKPTIKKPLVHIVKPGDTLWKISQKYSVSIEQICKINSLPLSGNINLKIGQVLKLQNISNRDKITINNPQRISAKHTYHIIQDGETIGEIAKIYNVKTSDILSLNGITNPNRIKVGTKIYIPGYGTREGRGRINLGSRTLGGINFIRPVVGKVISDFGYRRHPIFRRVMMHTGVDISSSRGTYVRASKSGRVVYSGWKVGYGKLVILKHPGNIETYYAHNSQNLVRCGEYVEAGEVIAKVGSTGWSTGPHLHFEIRKNGIPINPIGYIRRR